MVIGKLKKLKKILRQMDSVLVAFSGGVDSTFLLKVAAEALPHDKLFAVTADAATYPKEELLFAKKIARKLKVRHKIIKTNELRDKRFRTNPANRCYFCKKELFGRLKKIAAQEGLSYVADASNLSDNLDFRPGNKAKKELKVRSPLVEAGFNKEDIRKASKLLGIETWNKPALACLASRIPYGIKISPQVLNRIYKAEIHLKKIGFEQLRLRHYNGLCRIEVGKNEIPRLIDRREQVVDKLKKLGYNYITIDLEGYRTGSLNEVIKQ